MLDEKIIERMDALYKEYGIRLAIHARNGKYYLSPENLTDGKSRKFYNIQEVSAFLDGIDFAMQSQTVKNALELRNNLFEQREM